MVSGWSFLRTVTTRLKATSPSRVGVIRMTNGILSEADVKNKISVQIQDLFIYLFLPKEDLIMS